MGELPRGPGSSPLTGRDMPPIQNLFEVNREEWRLPVRENPVSKLKIVCETTRRERPLRDGEGL